MGLPLRSGNKVIGVLDIQSEETAAFDERDIELLSIVADQISIAIQNANQFQEAQSALEEARTAYRQYVQREWRTFIHEEKRLGYRYSPAGVGPLKARVRSNDIEIANATGQTRTSQTESQTQIVVPIKLRGEVVGVLNIKTDGFHPIDSDEVDVTEAVAERVALAMDNMRLLKTSQDQAARERTISAIASKIGASTNLKNVLQTAVEELGRIMPGADVTIQLGSNEQE
jgi:GAF domain-containing protein